MFSHVQASWAFSRWANSSSRSLADDVLALEPRPPPTLCLPDHAPFTLARPAREISRTTLQHNDWPHRRRDFVGPSQSFSGARCRRIQRRDRSSLYPAQHGPHGCRRIPRRSARPPCQMGENNSRKRRRRPARDRESDIEAQSIRPRIQGRSTGGRWLGRNARYVSARAGIRGLVSTAPAPSASSASSAVGFRRVQGKPRRSRRSQRDAEGQANATLRPHKSIRTRWPAVFSCFPRRLLC